MREIKFRGRNIEGKWLYGDLLQVANEVFIAPSDGDWFDFIPWSRNNVFHLPAAKYAVIPETVGQFTGLHDKNGKEIYDGDIIKIYDSVAGCVRYNAKYWRYEVAAPKEPIDNERIPSGTPSECWEIIGNIHDNPELINN